jgi:histidinol-phosphate aminotransferase
MKIRECLKDMVPYSPGKLKPGAIKLASNENPLGISPKASDAVKQSIASISLYPDGACVKLKKALSKQHNLASANFCVGNGSDEVLVLIAGAYIEPGDNAVTSQTTFSEYTFATKLFGGTMKYAPMVDGCFQLDAIASLIDAKTKLVFLCNPNNPTGTSFSNDELMAFMKKVPKDTLVVLDEAYREYVDRNDFPESISLLNEYDNVIILRTFSKIYGLAGLRVGYGIARPEVITDMEKTRAPFNVNSLAQAAACAALDDTDFVNKSRAVNREGKTYLYASFDKLGLKYYKTDANFILVYINQDCVAAFEKMMSLGITIRPLRSFGLNDAIRVTIGTPEQNEFFVRCLERVLGK